MRRLLCLLFLTAAAAPLPADEVVLRDGTVIVGSVTRRGDVWIVETRDGTVRVGDDEVARHRTDDELRAELHRLHASVPSVRAFHHLGLARLAMRYDLEDEMWHHLDQALRATQDGSRTRDRLDRTLASLEPWLLPRVWLRAEPVRRARELLRRERDATGVRRRAVVLVLAGMEGADEKLARRARGALDVEEQILAFQALLERDQGGIDQFLYRTLMLADLRSRRESLAEVLLDAGRGRAAVQYVESGLEHEHPGLRIRTAEVLGALGTEEALDALVARAPAAATVAAAAGGGSRRAHIAVLQQQAYVRDYDVQVAQASFIADPQVDTLQWGSVLDVTVHAVTVQRVQIVGAMRKAIARIAGEDPGPEVDSWVAWLEERRARAAPAMPGSDETEAPADEGRAHGPADPSGGGAVGGPGGPAGGGAARGPPGPTGRATGRALASCDGGLGVEDPRQPQRPLQRPGVVLRTLPAAGTRPPGPMAGQRARQPALPPATQPPRARPTPPRAPVTRSLPPPGRH